MTPDCASISCGDLAWWRGQRGEARRAWLAALAAAGDDRAVEAMARIRLLQVSGTAGPFVHELALDRALDACPATDPRCALAEADWQLWMPAFTGADPAMVARILPRDDGPALARRVAAGEPIELLAGRDDLDGMGLGILETGRALPSRPGTWAVALGAGAAPGEGAGGLVRYSNPDFAWREHRLEAAAGFDSRGGAYLSGALTTASRWQFTALGARQVGSLVVDDVVSEYTLATLAGTAAWVPRGPDAGAQLGAGARVDGLGGETLPVAGPIAALTLGDRRTWTRLGAETGFGAYTHLQLGWDTRAYPTVAGGTLAARAAWFVVPTEESPFFRLPSAGGSTLLRGVPAGWYRERSMFATQAEFRRVVRDPLGLAVFVDAAWTGEWHATAGVGMRLHLDGHVTRLDVGWCPSSWGIVAAWGEAF